MTSSAPSTASQPGDARVYEAPIGQIMPEASVAHSRSRGTVLVVITMVVLALAAWGLTFLGQVAVDRWQLAEAAVLFVCYVLAASSPVQVAYKVQQNLGMAIQVAAVLLLPPWMAAPVLGIGYLIGYGIQFHWSIEIDGPFNAADVMLSTAIAGTLLTAVGWDRDQVAFDPLPSLAAVVIVLVVSVSVSRVSNAVVIAVSERIPLVQVLRDLTVGAQRAELLAEAGLAGVGLLAAILVREEPWATLLLLIPVLGIFYALRQHVEVRHRIEASLWTAQSVARLGSLDWDLSSGDLRWSDELFRILGLDPRTDVAAIEAYLSRVHPDDRQMVASAFSNASGGAPTTLDHRMLVVDGEDGAVGLERHLHLRFDTIRDKSARPKRIVGTIHDVTDRKILEDRLAYQAYHDALTGLPNRAMFVQRLDQAVQRLGRRQPQIALLFLDLDRFKLVNDTLGHEAGDQLLIAVAERLQSCVRPFDVVARLGGDEFTVLLDGVADDDEVVRVARRIIHAVTIPVTLLGSREVFVSTSIGIVRPADDRAVAADLLRDADTALYRAKERGRNQFAIFDASMGEATRERVALEVDLRRAIERGELELAYQPKVELATGRVVTVESFLRWQHPTRGSIPPADFIPIAEESGLIDPVGAWAIRRACLDAARWAVSLADPPALSVNLSSRQLHDPELIPTLTRLLTETGLAPERLRVEVSEQSAMKNPEAVVETLHRLRGIGIQAAIDDFGTGYSSLTSLRRFPVDTLQLDHQFVTELGDNREAEAIVEAVIGMGRGLGLTVVAEGVERADQAALLADLGCTHAQGNHYTPPLLEPAITTFLVAREHAAVAMAR
jgi:diguanylate cyclase (GGDEF)-like protein